LASLKREGSLNTKGLHRNISFTQRLVQESAQIVHQFARDLRPAVLDDLGLVPALRAYLNNFQARTGLRTHMTVFTGFGPLDPVRRTVLFRVAQEGLTNIARHARASRVDIAFRRLAGDGIRMTIRDDGRSFRVERVLLARDTKRLGLLGMRERLEMIGGKLEIASAPGRGTTLTAMLPPNLPPRPRPRKEAE
jgi:signal transduction histidine kinase